ncbi:Nicotinate phosphoribosyltransferase (NAPRTase) family [Nakaseomyces glabratus]|nr:Nicotinate phosphoribosyltransferase (NAPRTase) family [Nakaseomyces glabratus]KAH7582643.1 Nicotinate phosphoribosyltransferase (NAPRTase) family [Nakaseomyces glabratus]
MSRMTPAITSLLDTDMYKITMHAAVFTNFPDARVVYKFTNRTAQFHFNKRAVDWIKEQFRLLGDLTFTHDDVEYLAREIPFLPAKYLHYIENGFTLKPDEQIELDCQEIKGKEDQYDLHILVKGLWIDTILYEIPILALLSEAYFKFVDTDWDYENQLSNAKEKALRLFENNLSFSEFGTRRRRSFKTQDLVMEGIMQAVKENPEKYRPLLLGTSNILFAKKYGVKPIGTVAHEWIMGIASITGDYPETNRIAMDYWIKTFGKEHAGLALTDTFGTDDFLKSFKPPYSDYYIGVRQDSGDPIKYTEKIAHHFHDVLKLPKFSKFICYSDSLNIDKAIEYGKVAEAHGIKSTFGIGTNFTNDFHKKSDPSVKSAPLNIVIKLLEVNGNHSIKISDNAGKNMGDPDTVKKVKEQLGYVERQWAGGNEAHRSAA